jgi:hypothetical protein
MTNDPGDIPPTFANFLNDFYVECDEHLAIARRTALTLESHLSD